MHLWGDTGPPLDMAGGRKEGPDYLKYDYVKILGRGTDGAAHLLRDPITSRTVVCKVLSPPQLHGSEKSLEQIPEEVETILSEVSILASLRHPHVISYFGSQPHGRNQVLLFMEYAEGGSLARAVRAKSKAEARFTVQQITRWMSQLASALRHVHCKQVLHRDLKTANVFLSSRQDVKLGDFGRRTVASHAISYHLISYRKCVA